MKYDRKLFKFNSRSARWSIRHRLSMKHKGKLFVLDNYNGRLLDVENEKWDVEHIIPLSLAWHSGFEKQYASSEFIAAARMKMFSNDQRNLIPVAAGSNRSRGANSLWTWLPLNTHYIPTRNATVRELFLDYGLKMSDSQKWALDFADAKINKKYKHGYRLNSVRAWLIGKGFHRILMPF
jgi:hypothetical protein